MQERSPTSWFAGSLRVGDETTPANAVLEAFKSSGPQLRLWQSAPDYADFTVDSTGNLSLGVSGTKIMLESGTFFQSDHSNSSATSQQMLWMKSSGSVVVSQTASGTETAFATNGYVAAKFNTGSNTSIRGVTVRLRKNASVNPMTQVRAFIYTNNAGQPGTSIAISTWGIFAGSLSTTMGAYDLQLEHSGLSASTDYWLVLQVASQTAGVVYVGDLSVQATPLYATSSNGSSWTTWNNSFYFQLKALPHLPITGESDFREGIRATSTNFYAAWLTSGRGIALGGVGYIGGLVIGAIRGYGAYIYSTQSYAGYFIQQGTLDENLTQPVLYARRALNLAGFTATSAVVDIDDTSGSTGALIVAKQNTVNRFVVNYEGRVSINNASVGTNHFAVTGTSLFNGTALFNGTLTVSGTSIGYSSIVPGNSTNPGYIEFRTFDNTRRGYVGWNDGSSRLLIAAEAGWAWSFNTTPLVGSNTIWHAGNDGAASTLDADLLDGQHGAYYLDTSATAQTKSGTLTVGNARITGMTTGSIMFISGSNQLTQDNANFFWDNTNKGLRIGNRALSTSANHPKTTFIVGSTSVVNDYSYIQSLQLGIGMSDTIANVVSPFAHNMLAFWTERNSANSFSATTTGGSISSAAETYAPGPTFWNNGMRYWCDLTNTTGSSHQFTFEFTTSDVNVLATATGFTYLIPYIAFRNVGNMPTNIKVEMRFNDNNTYATLFDGAPTFVGDVWRGIARQSPGGSFALTGIKFTLTVASNPSIPCAVMELGLTTNWRNPVGSILYASPFASRTWTQNQTFSGGTTVFGHGTSNLLLFSNNGLGAPAFTTRSAGTKIALYNSLTGSAADYALGMESSSMWFSVANNTSTFFHWYGGTTRMMTLTAGSLGLGTSTPAAANSTGVAVEIENDTNGEFHIYQSSDLMDVFLRGSTSDGACVGTHSNHTFTVRTNNVDRMWFTNNGRVGVNTALPQGAFHVDGAIHFTEQSTDPSAANLTSSAMNNFKDRLAIYMKNDKLVIAYNNSGTVTYLSIPLNGSSTTWTHNTTAP